MSRDDDRTGKTMNQQELRELLKTIFGNSLRKAAPVADEPFTYLTAWSVRRVSANIEGKGDSIHLVGWAEYEGRVSTAIQQYDQTLKQAISRSGRTYQLHGPPGHNRDAEYVWSWWLNYNGNPCWEDISDDYI